MNNKKNKKFIRFANSNLKDYTTNFGPDNLFEINNFINNEIN